MLDNGQDAHLISLQRLTHILDMWLVNMDISTNHLLHENTIRMPALLKPAADLEHGKHNSVMTTRSGQENNVIRFNGDYCTVVKAACLESRRSRVQTPLWPSSFKETKCFFSAHSQRLNIVGSLRDREIACSASDRQGSDFESCVWREVSYFSS